MPVVTKQTNKKPTARKTGSILDEIQKVTLERRVSMVIFGRSGTGKTRFACTFPKPILIVGAENGTASVSGDNELYFLPLSSSQRMKEVIEVAAPEYATTILDTASMLQRLTLMEILGVDDLPEKIGWGVASQQQWGQVGVQVTEYLSGLIELSKHGKNILIIAQERNFNDQASDADSDILSPSIGPGLMPSVAGWLTPACNYSVQTFIRRGYTYKEDMVGKTKVKRKVPSGKVEFCLRTSPHEAYHTKFRVPRGTELPDVVTDPSYEKLLQLKLLQKD